MKPCTSAAAEGGNHYIELRFYQQRTSASNQRSRLSDFLKNLERSPYFEQIVPDSIRETGGLQVWSLSFDFVIPSREQPAAQVSELQ